MNDDDFDSFEKTMLSLYETIKWSDEVRNLWRHILRPYHIDAATEALRDHAARSRFKPKPSEIRKRLSSRQTCDDANQIADARDEMLRVEQQACDQDWDETHRRFNELPSDVAEQHKASELRTNHWLTWAADTPVGDRLWVAVIVHARLLKGLGPTDPSVHHREQSLLGGGEEPVREDQAGDAAALAAEDLFAATGTSDAPVRN